MDIEISSYIPIFLEGMFFVLLLFFTLYGLFLGYHWFSFGTNKRTSTIALSMYLFGGAVLFLTFAAAL